MAEPHIIGIASQKGGVGKTTISINLAVALKTAGYGVLLVDADITNPCVGIHLGIGRVNTGYTDVLSSRAELGQTIVVHATTGLHVLPGNINSGYSLPSASSIDEVGAAIAKTNYDYIIFDTAPGFLVEDLTKIYSEAIIITTPEMSAATSCMRLARDYDNIGKPHNLVVNRIKNKKYEISTGELEEIYEKKLMVDILEEEIVPISISEHIPAYIIGPNTEFYKSINKIARRYIKGAVPPTAQQQTGFQQFIKKMLGLH